jgi:hypothetical protein
MMYLRFQNVTSGARQKRPHSGIFSRHARRAAGFRKRRNIFILAYSFAFVNGICENNCNSASKHLSAALPRPAAGQQKGPHPCGYGP